LTKIAQNYGKTKKKGTNRGNEKRESSSEVDEVMTEE